MFEAIIIILSTELGQRFCVNLFVYIPVMDMDGGSIDKYF